MSLFYDTLDKDTNFDFKRRKKAFKKGKPCAICGKRLVSELMMVAHKVPVSELSDYEALYDTTNWEVRCIFCERALNHAKDVQDVEDSSTNDLSK